MIKTVWISHCQRVEQFFKTKGDTVRASPHDQSKLTSFAGRVPNMATQLFVSTEIVYGENRARGSNELPKFAKQTHFDNPLQSSSDRRLLCDFFLSTFKAAIVGLAFPTRRFDSAISTGRESACRSSDHLCSFRLSCTLESLLCLRTLLFFFLRSGIFASSRKGSSLWFSPPS